MGYQTEHLVREVRPAIWPWVLRSESSRHSSKEVELRRCKLRL